ncbi:kinase-like domain-containing protein [Hypoxylon crocopeplum]|nr:kinase-like domain-containing protein [Hypoxylon crocopeplum]
MSEWELANTLREYFSDQNRFRWEKTLPAGVTGFLFCFQERSLSTNDVRRFVVKCPQDPIETAIRGGINNEKNWLQYAEHVINILTIENNPLLPNVESPDGFDYDYVILEYMENGTLGTFLERIQGENIPNRILWYLFLCMVRACVEMAYPPEAGGGEQTRSSVIPSTLGHWDMHNNNFMFGSLYPNDFEHHLVPILKLIDFDLATEGKGEGEMWSKDAHQKFDEELELFRHNQQSSVRNHGINANVLGIGMAMCCNVRQEEWMSRNNCREAIQHELPYLDDDLQMLILRCLAVDPENRPSLEELLTTTYAAVSTRDAVWYDQAGWPTRLDETDEAIRDIVQGYILDADKAWI